MRHVIYYPFDDDAGKKDCEDIAKLWTQYGLDKTFSPAFWAGMGQQKLVGPIETLYIVGHCGPGSDNLQSEDRTTNISASDLAAIVQREGLPKTFNGKIKIFACSSSSCWQLPVSGWLWDSFAQRFADNMMMRGYTECRYFGYSKNVNAAYTKIGNTMHKRAPKGLWGGYMKASDAREQIYPRTTPMQIVIE